jgi:hypothetical protein
MIDSISIIQPEFEGFSLIQTTQEFSYQGAHDWFELLVVHTNFDEVKYFVKTKGRKNDKPVLREKSKGEVILLLARFIESRR